MVDGMGDRRASGSWNDWTPVGPESLALYPGASATVSTDLARDVVVLTIVDDAGPSLTVEMPTQAASDLALVLVNAANGF
jgi:hypothetical protein